MDNKFLLTYCVIGSPATFEWFNTEEDLKYFVANTKDVNVFEALEIPYAKEIELP